VKPILSHISYEESKNMIRAKCMGYEYLWKNVENNQKFQNFRVLSMRFQISNFEKHVFDEKHK
jgi:hypothetical protein